MGVVNVTPDSFSDGGRFLDARAAIEHGQRAGRRGRRDPRRRRRVDAAGRRPVGEDEELRRVVPVVEGLAARRGVSIDTSKAARRRARRSTPARDYVNDVTAFRGDPSWPALVAERGRRLLPHAHARRAAHDAGRPALRRRRRPRSRRSSRSGSRSRSREGVAEERVWLDPGIGFGKTLEHNLELIAAAGRDRRDRAAGRVRRVAQAFLGKLTGRAVGERAVATAAANVLALERGAASSASTTSPETVDALTVAAATLADRWPATSPRTTTTTT